MKKGSSGGTNRQYVPVYQRPLMEIFHTRGDICHLISLLTQGSFDLTMV